MPKPGIGLGLTQEELAMFAKGRKSAVDALVRSTFGDDDDDGAKASKTGDQDNGDYSKTTRRSSAPEGGLDDHRRLRSAATDNILHEAVHVLLKEGGSKHEGR